MSQFDIEYTEIVRLKNQLQAWLDEYAKAPPNPFSVEGNDRLGVWMDELLDQLEELADVHGLASEHVAVVELDRQQSKSGRPETFSERVCDVRFKEVA